MLFRGGALGLLCGVISLAQAQNIPDLGPDATACTSSSSCAAYTTQGFECIQLESYEESLQCVCSADFISAFQQCAECILANVSETSSSREIVQTLMIDSSTVCNTTIPVEGADQETQDELASISSSLVAEGLYTSVTGNDGTSASASPTPTGSTVPTASQTQSSASQTSAAGTPAPTQTPPTGAGVRQRASVALALGALVVAAALM
ncbi:hypothetical protein ACM66B_004914 [Microbotryomycetes sp. NB124-2]